MTEVFKGVQEGDFIRATVLGTQTVVEGFVTEVSELGSWVELDVGEEGSFLIYDDVPWDVEVKKELPGLPYAIVEFEEGGEKLSAVRLPNGGWVMISNDMDDCLSAEGLTTLRSYLNSPDYEPRIVFPGEPENSSY